MDLCQDGYRTDGEEILLLIIGQHITINQTIKVYSLLYSYSAWIYRHVPGRTMLTHTSFCRELIILPGTCFTLSLIYHLYVLFVWISYQARFGLKISYPAIVFTMVIGLLNCGSIIVHILLLGTSKVFTLSVFLLCACVHVLLPGTRRYECPFPWWLEAFSDKDVTDRPPSFVTQLVVMSWKGFLCLVKADVH